MSNTPIRHDSHVHQDDQQSSCKLRAYLNAQQHRTLSHQLYWVQKFRNQVVEFCNNRRSQRTAWIAQHPDLFVLWKQHQLNTKKATQQEKQQSILSKSKPKSTSPSVSAPALSTKPNPASVFPDFLDASDIAAASVWLTQRLNQARLDVSKLWNIQSPKNELRATMFQHFGQLTRAEQQEIPDAWLLTLPRTILDQCLQDMNKTYNKAIKDRATLEGSSKNSKKPAGFPQFKKHSYPYSVRYQIATTRNKTYVEAWNDAYAHHKKTIYIPSLGMVKFRDAQHLPAIPPEMITVARNGAGHFYLTFVNKDSQSKTNQKLRGVNNHVLPMEDVVDPNTGKVIQVPVTRGNDVGLKTLGTYSQALALENKEVDKKNAQRVRFFKKYQHKMRHHNKSVARKTRGSKRWQKAKQKLGALHVKISNCRQEYLKQEAQLLVKHTAIVCLEDLQLAFMLRNKHLAKSAYDASLGAFKQYIRWEARKLGHLILECGRFDASSKTCHRCQYYYKDLSLKDRSWTCPGCHALHDRDENAAINIRQMALHKAIQTLQASGKDVRMLANYPLHKDLVTFIKRGGLTSLLGVSSSERYANEALISSINTSDTLNGTVDRGKVGILVKIQSWQSPP